MSKRRPLTILLVSWVLNALLTSSAWAAESEAPSLVKSLQERLWPLYQTFAKTSLNQNLLRQRCKLQRKYGVLINGHLQKECRQLIGDQWDLVVNPCTLRYIWGHQQDTREASKEFADNSVVGLGCHVRRLGSVSKLDQNGFNGGWSKQLKPENNGWLNPILSLRTKYLKEDEKDEFETHEIEEIRRQLKEKSGSNVTDDDVILGIREVNSVGFMRLASFSWYALLNQAIRRIESGCQTVYVQFICASEKGGRYGTNDWNGRISQANNATLFSQIEGKTIRFALRRCTDGHTPIWNVPQRCGESVQITNKTVEDLKAGPCYRYMNYFNAPNPYQMIESGGPIDPSEIE